MKSWKQRLCLQLMTTLSKNMSSTPSPIVNSQVLMSKVRGHMDQRTNHMTRMLCKRLPLMTKVTNVGILVNVEDSTTWRIPGPHWDAQPIICYTWYYQMMYLYNGFKLKIILVKISSTTIQAVEKNLKLQQKNETLVTKFVVNAARYGHQYFVAVICCPASSLNALF